MISIFVKNLVNHSFSEGIVPKSYKSAQISLDHKVVQS